MVQSVQTLRELLSLFVFRCVWPLLQDSSQIGLLKELLDLQKDMVVMLLSLLEGASIYPLIREESVRTNRLKQ